MDITTELVKRLVEEQFPQWKDLEVRPVARSGHDNRTFHLGNTMAVRLPSGKNYAAQSAKEIRWLPYLQNHLDFPISKPVAAGKPTEYYPFPWSVNLWLEGNTLFEEDPLDQQLFAKDLAAALKKLQAIDGSDGPRAGIHNFYRGGDLKVYHTETVEACRQLADVLPVSRLSAIWDRCISSIYQDKEVWVHGDIAPGNILLQNHHFHALIDFGVMAVGDPACDYAMAWTYFDKKARKIFLDGLKEDMVDRARGWALWKALITYNDENPIPRENAHFTIREILLEETA